VYATDTIFINCVFGKNSAKGDGGGCNDGGFDASFVNCLFYENSASSGGAIVTRDKIINCTFFNNKAKEKGGAIMYGRRSNGKTINSIFYKNIARGENNDIEIRAGNSLDIDYCLINHLKGAANFGSYNITGDPKFVDAENGDFSLRVDSPCIDKGSDEDIKKIIEKFKEASMDLAGSQRIVGEKVDLGAYECVRQ